MDRRPAQGLNPVARAYPSPAPPRPDLFDAELDELVAGRRPVEEAFVARREARRLLVVPQRRQALEKLVLHATNLRIPIVEVEGGTLTALAGFDGHQGIALVVAPRRYAEVDDILARSIERGEPPFILVLDSLEDPQNVGSLLRSAEAAGTDGVVFPTHHQAPLSPSAIKASAGAVEHLLLAPVDDLAGALADLHVRGLRIVGADADASLTVREADLRGPLALVVGSEGQGLGAAVRRRCDLLVRIPMRGAVGSLNASVAGSILLYEAITQRGGPTEAPIRRREAELPGIEVEDVGDSATAEEPEASLPPETVAARTVKTGVKRGPKTAAKAAKETPRAKTVAKTVAKAAPAKAPSPKRSAATSSDSEPTPKPKRAARKTTPPKASTKATIAGPGRGHSPSSAEADVPGDALLPGDAAPSPAPARPRKRRSTSPPDPTAERG